MLKLNTQFTTPRTMKAPAKKAALAGQAVELKISLRYLKPLIWRSFVVPGDIKLHRLHDVIQVVMGWTNSHLHSFGAGQQEYGMLDPDDFGGGSSETNLRDERKHTLSDLVTKKGDKFTYIYDFGDDWVHEIKVVSVKPADEKMKAAICLAGERACPPEDCGGFPGYLQLLETLSDPKHPEHDSMLEWVGGDFNPEQFDLAAVNRALLGIRV